jgi:hypothetical protein
MGTMKFHFLLAVVLEGSRAFESIRIDLNEAEDLHGTQDRSLFPRTDSVDPNTN